MLLTLLEAVGEPVGNADFQALLFLYTQECEATPCYDFVPDKCGAFSFTAGRLAAASGDAFERRQLRQAVLLRCSTSRQNPLDDLRAVRGDQQVVG